jgi:hypothetical protein
LQVQKLFGNALEVGEGKKALHKKDSFEGFFRHEIFQIKLKKIKNEPF